MKKILFTFSAVLFVLASCSGDDQNPSNPDPSIEVPDPPQPVNSILPKKRIYGGDEGSSYVQDILYDGNKIVSITAEQSTITYTYTGNLITKIEETDNDRDHSLVTEYAYTNDKLDSSIVKLGFGATHYYKTIYTHNEDETVSYAQYKIDLLNGAEEQYSTIGKYTFKEGNLVKNETSHSFIPSQSLEIYEYDTKNNPLRNVLGLNLLLDQASVNNLVKKTTTSGSGSNIYTTEVIYTNTYNTNNFLTEQVAAFTKEDATYTDIIQYVY